MPPFKAAFEDDMIAVPRHEDVLSDLRAIQVIRGVPKLPDGNTSSGKNKRHGDSAIALCMAWSASKMDTIEYAYHPVRGNDRHKDDIKPRQIRTGRGLRANRGSLL